MEPGYEPRREPPRGAAVGCISEPQDLLAHAVVYSPEGHEHDYWAPDDKSFVHLRLPPRLSDSGSARDMQAF